MVVDVGCGVVPAVSPEREKSCARTQCDRGTPSTEMPARQSFDASGTIHLDKFTARPSPLLGGNDHIVSTSQ